MRNEAQHPKPCVGVCVGGCGERVCARAHVCVCVCVCVRVCVSRNAWPKILHAPSSVVEHPGETGIWPFLEMLRRRRPARVGDPGMLSARTASL